MVQSKEYNVEQPPPEEEERYSEDRTSTNMSETQESRFYKELIQTQEVSTQLTLVDQDTLRDLQESEEREVVQVYERQSEDADLPNQEFEKPPRRKSTTLPNTQFTE